MVHFENKHDIVNLMTLSLQKLFFGFLLTLKPELEVISSAELRYGEIKDNLAPISYHAFPPKISGHPVPMYRE